MRVEWGLTPSTLLDQEGYERNTLPLPEKSVVAAAINTYRKNHDGKLPDGRSPNEDIPQGWPNGRSYLIGRMNEEWGLAPSELLQQHGYTVKVKANVKSKKPQIKGLNAPDIFNGVVRFIRAKKALPLQPDDMVAGRKVSFLQEAFKIGNVNGFEKIPTLAEAAEENYPLGTDDAFENFIVAAGFAIQSLEDPKKLIMPEWNNPDTDEQTYTEPLPDLIAA